MENEKTEISAAELVGRIDATVSEAVKKALEKVEQEKEQAIKSMQEQEKAAKEQEEAIKKIVDEKVQEQLKNVNPFNSITVGADRNEQPVGSFKSHRDAEIFGTWLKGLHYDKRNESIEQLNKFGVKTHYAGNNSSGGYFVPVEVSYAIIDQLQKYGNYSRYGRTVNVSTDTFTVPRIVSGLTGYYVGEAQAPTESQASFEELQVHIKEIAGLTTMSRRLFDDSAVNLAQFIAPLFVQAISKVFDNSVINGDGTSTHGGIIGLRQALRNVDGTIGNIKGLKVASGNAWSEITIEDLRNTVAKLDSRFRTGAQWVMSQAFYDEVVAPKIQSSTFVGTDVTQAPIERLFGYPILMETLMPTTEANRSICALFGNYQTSAIIGNRQSISVESTNTNGTDWADGKIAYKASARMGYTVLGEGDTTAAGSYVGLITAAS